MGSGIAHACAVAGFTTIVAEIDASAQARARRAIESSLDGAVAKGKLDADGCEAARSRLSVVTDVAAFAAADLVVEAVVESLSVKQGLWLAVDRVAPPSAIFASNTSSLSITEQAAVTKRADRVCGLHFFSPVPAMKLVEIVRGVGTSSETIDTVTAFVRRLGKEAIHTRDTPGFVVNLLLVPFMLDAIRALEHGVGSVRDIDLGMQLGAGHPRGPLALCDLVGLDTLERVAAIMYESYREQRYAPPPLLRRMVTAGRLGRKSGMGFYDYRAEPPVPQPVVG
jgi:3-hydroxybutyryl-CoA dehydrogenase